jgi:hypothetical protein
MVWCSPLAPYDEKQFLYRQGDPLIGEDLIRKLV